MSARDNAKRHAAALIANFARVIFVSGRRLTLIFPGARSSPPTAGVVAIRAQIIPSHHVAFGSFAPS